MARCRTVVPAALIFLSGAATASAADPVVPRAGVLLSGAIQFPRAQNMMIETDRDDSSKLTVRMGFDGKCKGGGLREVWSANVTASPRVRVRAGRFSATLTGTVRNLGRVEGRTGVFRWRLTGRFVRRDVVTATVTGSADVRIDGKTVSKCKIADPAAVRLAIRSA
jgi:hypothetical protein